MSRDDALRETDEGTADSLPVLQAVVITDSESMLLHRARRSAGNNRVYIAMVATIFGIVTAIFTALPFVGWLGAITSAISISLLLKVKAQGATLSSHMAILRTVTYVFNILHLTLCLVRLGVMIVAILISQLFRFL